MTETLTVTKNEKRDSHTQRLDTDVLAYMKPVYASAINTHTKIFKCVHVHLPTHIHTHRLSHTPVLQNTALIYCI